MGKDFVDFWFGDENGERLEIEDGVQRALYEVGYDGKGEGLRRKGRQIGGI